MGRAFGLLLMLIAMYVGLTLYTEGSDVAFGGLFASQQPPEAARELPLTERVQQRVSSDLAAGAERHGRDFEE